MRARPRKLCWRMPLVTQLMPLGFQTGRTSGFTRSARATLPMLTLVGESSENEVTLAAAAEGQGCSGVADCARPPAAPAHNTALACFGGAWGAAS